MWWLFFVCFSFKFPSPINKATYCHNYGLNISLEHTLRTPLRRQIKDSYALQHLIVSCLQPRSHMCSQNVRVGRLFIMAMYVSKYILLTKLHFMHDTVIQFFLECYVDYVSLWKYNQTKQSYIVKLKTNRNKR